MHTHTHKNVEKQKKKKNFLLMHRADSLEKTMMLGKIEGRKRRG